MSDEVKFVTKNCVKSCGIMKTEQHKGKRSFLITVDDNGTIEVSPKELPQEEKQNLQQKTKKTLRVGKQRIRIAVMEEEAASSEEDLDDQLVEDKNDEISIDAPTFEAMHDRFIKIYNKNLRGKPSFVVLEDALMRKQIEDTLQEHYNRHTCHCNAQQQTSSCDIGAHTGSQTDEFLLQYALRSQMKAHSSRGCQATDISIERPHTSTTISTSKRSLRVPSRVLQESMANNNAAPHVTISFVAPTAAAVPTAVQSQQQQLLQAANSHCHANCCHNCCLQQPAAGNSFYGLPATCSNCTACFISPQQQHQQQQQHHQSNNNHCSCCFLRPSPAQTTLGCGLSSHCSQQECQQQQLYPSPYNACQYYPMSTCNTASCCPMQEQNQQQQQQQQPFYHSDNNSVENNYPFSLANNSAMWSTQSKPVGNMSESKKPEQLIELENRSSQLTVRRLTSATPSNNEKTKKKCRHRAGLSSVPSKIFMARFGRTCLLLKPSVSTSTPTQSPSCGNSDMALSQN